MKTRQEALTLLNESVKSDSLKKHCLSVAYAMEAYVEKFNQNKEKFFITGLLHDFDYEIFPTIPEHCIQGSKILKEKGYPGDIIEAILGHAEYSGVPRSSIMAKCLFAVDELSGLLMALAKVRRDNFEGMDSHSVIKAMKKRGFAAAIKREDIEKGIRELGLSQDEHFMLVINALRKRKSELGF